MATTSPAVAESRDCIGLSTRARSLPRVGTGRLPGLRYERLFKVEEMNDRYKSTIPPPLPLLPPTLHFNTVAAMSLQLPPTIFLVFFLVAIWLANRLVCYRKTLRLIE